MVEGGGQSGPWVYKAPLPSANRACGWCPMPGGTLPFLWVVPYAGRNPPERDGGPHNPPRMGGVAALVERLEATPDQCSWILLWTNIGLELIEINTGNALLGACPVGHPGKGN